MAIWFYSCQKCGTRTDIDAGPEQEVVVETPCKCGGVAVAGLKPPMLRSPGAWPMHCSASGVHPSQVDEAYRESVSNGVPTHFDEDGCAILTSPEHRKEYLRSIGLYDRNAGLGDATPDDPSKFVDTMKELQEREAAEAAEEYDYAGAD